MMSGQIRAAAMAGALLLGGAGLSLCGASLALAAPAAAQEPARTAMGRSITPVAAVTETDEDTTTCSRSRRRLWVDGEGWIVRRVTTCR